MYLLGGFDGSRLNDMHNIALPLSLHEEDRDLMRIQSRPPTSGSMMTVTSDLEVVEDEEEMKRLEEKKDSTQRIELLQT